MPDKYARGQLGVLCDCFVAASLQSFHTTNHVFIMIQLPATRSWMCCRMQRWSWPIVGSTICSSRKKGPYLPVKRWDAQPLALVKKQMRWCLLPMEDFTWKQCSSPIPPFVLLGMLHGHPSSRSCHIATKARFLDTLLDALTKAYRLHPPLVDHSLESVS